ncbi:MAG: YdcF family protein [Terrimicrobiaceae bacterium]
MIYLHKILPLFFMPFTLAVLLLAAGLLLKRRAVVFVGLCVLCFFSVPLVAKHLFASLEGNLERLTADEALSADAIVVLSGAGVNEQGKSKVIEWNDPDRFFGGVQLYNAGKAPLLIFTGGWLPWDAAAQPEGAVLVEQARLLGVPAAALATTRKVLNTADEAVGVSQVLRERFHPAENVPSRNPRVLLVTSAYHMPRAKRLFEKVGMEVIPFPVDFRSSHPTSVSLMDLVPNSGALEVSETAIREFYGRLYYRLKP